jgi:DNA-binding beta-propeller fold protein YncE
VAFVLAALIAAVVGSDATARPAKGEGPTAIAAGFGSVWVGTGAGAVIRIDARTGRVQRIFRGGGFVHALAKGFGSIWALQDRVVRIEPRQETVRVLPETGSATTFNLAPGAGAVWVADDGRDVVDRIDPRRTRRVASIRIPGRAFGLAASDGLVLVVSVPTSGPVTGPAGRRFLRRVEPATNRVSAPLVRLRCDPGIAITPETVWTTDPCAGTLAQRDRQTLAARASQRIGRWRTPVTGFASLWLIGSDSVLRIDPRTLRVIASIRAGGTTAAVGEGALWLLRYLGTDAAIRRIDPRTNRVSAPIRVPTP